MKAGLLKVKVTYYFESFSVVLFRVNRIKETDCFIIVKKAEVNRSITEDFEKWI
jgi:hypothetical protein